MLNFGYSGRLMRDPDPAGQQGGGGAGDAGAGDQGGWVATLPEDVRSGIPAEYAKDPNVTKYKDVGEFVKGHVNLSKLVGAKGVIVPSDKATPDELNKFYNDLGRPEKPEAYKFNMPEKLNPSLKITPDGQKTFAEAVHKMGLSQKQADGLNSWYLKWVSDAMDKRDASQGEEMKKMESELKGKWGEKYDSTIAGSKALIESKVGKEKAQALFDKYGNDPLILEFLGETAKDYGEDHIKKPGGSQNMGDIDAAKAELDKFKTVGTPEYTALMNERDPRHDEMVKRRAELYDKAFVTT